MWNGLFYIHMDKTTQFTKKVCVGNEEYYMTWITYFTKPLTKLNLKKCVIFIFIVGVGGQIYEEWKI